MQIYPIAPVDHGRMLGLGDDDHPQYIKDSEFTVNSGFLVGTGAGTFQEETGATARTSLGLGTIATEDIAAIGASMLPSDTNTYDLGSSAKVWANIYGTTIDAVNVNIAGAIGDITLKPYGLDEGGGEFESGIEILDNKTAEGSLSIYADSANSRWEFVPDNNSLLFGASVQTGDLTAADVTIGSGKRIYFAESGVGDTSIRASSSDYLDFEVGGVDAAFEMWTGGFVIRGSGADGSGMLQIADTAGATRPALKHGTAGNIGDSATILALTNRTPNGVIEIQPSTAAGGSAGETTITRFEHDKAKIYGAMYIGDGGVTNYTSISSTGNVILPAGAAAAGRAPLKFQDGTTLDTPEAGVLNYTDSKFCITNVATCRVIDRTSNVITETVTVANEDTETVLWTGPMPANSLLAGNVFKFHADGVVSNNGNNSANDFTIRVRVGGISGDIAASLTPTTKAMTDVHWHVDANATQRTLGGSGSRAIHLHLQVGDADEETILGLATVDTTANMDVVVTIDWVTAHDNNSISLYQGFMEYKN